MELGPLVGIVIVVAGFALRLNALAVVTVAGLATGLAAGMGPHAVIAAFGHAYVENRYLAVVWFILPVIGLLERCGLREQAQKLIGRVRSATTGRLLTLYLLFRQITAALGLLSLGGHPQMVRPLIAPMAEASAVSRHGALDTALVHRIRAHAAAVDNIGAFFGEDIFIAVGSILLMKGFIAGHGPRNARLRCSNPPSLPIAATASSPIQTASTCHARGAGPNWPPDFPPTIAAAQSCSAPPAHTARPAWRIWKPTAWAATGWRASPAWPSPRAATRRLKVYSPSRGEVT